MPTLQLKFIVKVSIMDDILERLKASTKINGAYPRDIAEAINEIERLREALNKYSEEDILFAWDDGIPNKLYNYDTTS